MESAWSGDAENSFFSAEKIDKQRIIMQPEYGAEHSNKTKNFYYVLGVDVGRKGCTTEVVVIKVFPQAQGTSLKTVVNLYTYEDEHFEQQAINLKKLYYKYNARIISLDANGLGIGLMDYMIKSQTDIDGSYYPPFGVFNDKDNFYRKFITSNTVKDAIYQVKGNPTINTEIYSYVQSQLLGGKIRFLIDEVQAKNKLMTLKMGQLMDRDARAEYLKPFVLTTILREQMLNLVEEREGVNIILKQSSKGVRKDKFSALGYACYYIKLEEEQGRKRKNRNIKDLMLFN